MVDSTKLSSMEAVTLGEQYDRQKLQKLATGLQRLYAAVRRMESMLVGGTPAQVLAKTSARDFEGVWADAATGGGSGAVDSVVHGVGIEVNQSDPANPIVGLDGDSQASLGLADSAVQPGDLADIAFSGEFADLLNSPPEYLIQTEASKAWVKGDFLRGDNIIGVRTVGAAVLLPHDLEIEKIVTVKNETGTGGMTVAIY